MHSAAIEQALQKCKYLVNSGQLGLNEGKIKNWLSRKFPKGPRHLDKKKISKDVTKALPKEIADLRKSAYVFVPGVLEATDSPLTLSDLEDVEKAKYFYTTGEDFGSLMDLVMGTSGTTFPIETNRVHEVWGKP